MRRFSVFLFAAGTVAIFAACGSSDADSDPTPGPTVTTTAASPTAPSNATQVSSAATATATATPTATVPAATATTAPAETATAAATPVPQATTAATATKPAPAGNPASATMRAVDGTTFNWGPRTVKIAPGGSVTFTWSGGAVHDVSVPSMGFSSGGATVSGSHVLAFPSAGSYQVKCIIHPTMTGTIVVE